MKIRILALVLALLLCACALAQEERIYLALGDSGSTGYGLKEGELGFTLLVAAENGLTLENRAVNGSTIYGVLERMKRSSEKALIERAEVITLSCGGNDLLGLLYTRLSAAFEAMHGSSLPVSEVMNVLVNPADPRHGQLLECADAMVEGDAQLGIMPIAGGEDVVLALEQFVMGLNYAVMQIREMNPDVQLIVTTQFNPYVGLDGAYDGLRQVLEAGVVMLRGAIMDNAPAAGYAVADWYTAFDMIGGELCNASLEPFNLDIHANAQGQRVAADCVNEVIRGER